MCASDQAVTPSPQLRPTSHKCEPTSILRHVRHKPARIGLSVTKRPDAAIPVRCRNGDANGAASLAEASTSSVTSNGRADVIAPSVPRADMDIQPPLTIRRCMC